MNSIKYVGMDVHFATTSCAVLDSDGNQLSRSVIRTNLEAVRDFLNGLSGTVHLTFEEGTLAQWMFEITSPLVAKVVVCNARTLKDKGLKNDDLDALNLADLLRLKAIKGVYHQTSSVTEIKQLVAIYNQLTADRMRIINRLRAVFREQAERISITAKDELSGRIKKLPSLGHQVRAELLVSEFEAVSELRQKARKELVKEGKRHSKYELLQSLPGISEIRAAQLLAWVVTPHRFRTKRQFWSYCGLSVISRSSSDYETDKQNRIVKKKRGKKTATRGLNENYHRGLKSLLKAAALDTLRSKKLKVVTERLIEKGLDESIARVQVARKLAASLLAVWKTGKKFEVEKFIGDSG
jgi:hypothetical protein